MEDFSSQQLLCLGAHAQALRGYAPTLEGQAPSFEEGRRAALEGQRVPSEGLHGARRIDGGGGRDLDS